MAEVKFFLFGSLCSGLVHFDLFKDFIRSQSEAEARGTAYRLKVGYPVFIAEGQDRLKGELVTLEASQTLLGLLDQFHGYNEQDEAKSLYLRKEIQVSSGEGEHLAFAYALNPKKLGKDAELISGLDWRRELSQRQPLTDQLTERQASYIRRLGSSKGREIVPIDLGLYRELMNLELIVDKGRRLALSKLGHEVFRFLR